MMMGMTLPVLLLAVLFVSHHASGALPRGTGTWVYDEKNGQTAMWAQNLTGFNTRTSKPINIVFSYGGDMEYYPGSSNPYQTYFSAESQEAAMAYSKVPGVQSIITVVDGRMDGGQDWSPDLSKLTPVQLQTWANVTAATYCNNVLVSGIQIDLEPFRPPYEAATLVFLKQLAANLISETFGCVNSWWPTGRSISVFMFAEAATEVVFSALGPNGFVIVSGYDLSTAPPGTPLTPQQYRTNLDAAIKTILTSARAYNGKFMLGIPAAASTHEFTTYVDQDTGIVKQGYPMYSATADSYIVEAYGAIKANNLTSTAAYLGEALWGFSAKMAYPSNSNNLFTPSSPFLTPGEEDYLTKRLS
eukprot:TRINITY_DN3392_c0_g1_i2.p1 TRINITY_DN3392_c0_g1~~TRINITY_DN3392_c0_g1_i2.p1  ORF type:complete len:359 (+),score=87.02 TRINITY_DN3392_c0_g1_i2:28-1104(+)